MGASSDLTENGGFTLGLLYDKAQLERCPSRGACRQSCGTMKASSKESGKIFDESRTDRMTARYQEKYKDWCDNAIPRDLCDTLAATLGGSHASYVASINTPDKRNRSRKASLHRGRPSPAHRSGIFRQSSPEWFPQTSKRTLFFSRTLFCAYLARERIVGSRSYHIVLASEEAIYYSLCGAGRAASVAIQIGNTTLPPCLSHNFHQILGLPQSIFPLDGYTKSNIETSAISYIKGYSMRYAVGFSDYPCV